MALTPLSTQARARNKPARGFIGMAGSVDRSNVRAGKALLLQPRSLWRPEEGQASGLLIAHTLMVLPYVLLSLSPAYLGFDPRCAALSASLGHGRWRFLLRVKWPLLRRALAASAAVGFAVSVAQYLPTLFVGAGRWATVTTEAVTLASGGQRSLMSAYAALQMLLPIAAFALAAWLGRPRRFEKIAPMKATP